MSARRSQVWGWGCLAGGLLGLALGQPAFLTGLDRALVAQSEPGLELYLAGGPAQPAPWLLGVEGGRWGTYGWYLSPGQQGRLTIQLPGGASAGTLKIRLFGSDPGQIRIQLENGTTLQTLPAGLLNSGTTTLPVDSGMSRLVLTATNSGSAERLVLESVWAAWFPGTHALPSLWPVLLSLGVAGTGLLMLTLPVVRDVPPGDPRSSELRLWLGCGGLYAAAVIGMALRWAEFDIVRGLPLSPDVLSTWWPFARKFQWFSDAAGLYSGDFREREPFFVALLHYWLRLFGDTGSAVRLLTLCLSSLLIPAIGAFAWRVTGQWWLGVLGGVLVACNAEWIDLSVQGLRDETTALLFLGALSLWLWGRSWQGAISLGLMMGALFLARAPIVTVLLPFIWGGWLFKTWVSGRTGIRLSPSQWSWGHLIAATVIALGLYVPYVVSVARAHGGDFSWQSSWQARWNANFEFPDRIGTPGWPTRAEFEQDAYSGPRMTFGEYLFGLHPVSRLIFGQLKGWAESTVYMAASPAPNLRSIARLFSGRDAAPQSVPVSDLLFFAALVFVLIVGWLKLLADPATLWIPLLSLWGTWYAAFMYGVRLIEPFRQTCHVYSLLVVCQLWGVWVVVTWARQWSVARVTRKQAVPA